MSPSLPRVRSASVPHWARGSLGAAQIIAVDTDLRRLSMAKGFGATTALLAQTDPVRVIRELTGGHGVDVAIEALGMQQTFENALRVLRPGGTLSSVGV